MREEIARVVGYNVVDPVHVDERIVQRGAGGPGRELHPEARRHRIAVDVLYEGLKGTETSDLVQATSSYSRIRPPEHIPP